MTTKTVAGLSALTLTLLLSGCASTGENWAYWFDEDGNVTQAAEPVKVPDGSGLEYRPDSRDLAYKAEAMQRQDFHDPIHQGFSPAQTHKRLGDYASQLAMGLMDNATKLSSSDLIGIASFVRFNRSLQEPTILGNQLSEYLMTELQDYGLAVVDFKLTKSLSVTPYGDLALSRDAIDIARQVEMDHIVTGTMIEDERGVRVNARIIAVSNKQIVASASVFIPGFIVSGLYPQNLRQSDTDAANTVSD